MRRGNEGQQRGGNSGWNQVQWETKRGRRGNKGEEGTKKDMEEAADQMHRERVRNNQPRDFLNHQIVATKWTRHI